MYLLTTIAMGVSSSTYLSSEARESVDKNRPILFFSCVFIYQAISYIYIQSFNLNE